MPNWDELHSDPRISYYLFLRRGYGCAASEAHTRLKQMDAYVLVGLHMPREGWMSRLLRLCHLRTSRGDQSPPATTAPQLYP